MEHHAVHTYPCTADEVLDVLTDPELVRRKYEALGHRDVTLVERDVAPDGGVRIVTRRVVPLQLPGFAKRVLSPRQSVTQTDVWSGPDDRGARTGTFEVAAAGTPVRVHGTLLLEPHGTRGCSNTIDVTVECSLPLIGGKIAGFVMGDTRTAVDHEETWVNDHLAGA